MNNMFILKTFIVCLALTACVTYAEDVAPDPFSFIASTDAELIETGWTITDMSGQKVIPIPDSIHKEIEAKTSSDPLKTFKLQLNVRVDTIRNEAVIIPFLQGYYFAYWLGSGPTERLQSGYKIELDTWLRWSRGNQIHGFIGQLRGVVYANGRPLRFVMPLLAEAEIDSWDNVTPDEYGSVPFVGKVAFGPVDWTDPLTIEK